MMRGPNKKFAFDSYSDIWFSNDATKTLKTITLIFPVRGHSYMPADRVFGQIELKLCLHVLFIV